ncbi:hypothetical protein F5Y17DRAFT_471549 [Xylariaceae sp. FL0594]|nr:hypothetical protein F5Y17DRAFT_471549 [Xylariaceae sp. FL0594]
MRKEMVKVYHSRQDRRENAGDVWDPVLGAWGRDEITNAAHLYPSKSIKFMDIIFGPGSVKDISTASNGIFLDKAIEKALEQGYLAIVPDVCLEPADEEHPAADLHERRQNVKDWETRDPKEYKIIVLENSKVLRRSLFLTDFRPKARYMWWTYLNSIANISFRHKNNESQVRHILLKEVERQQVLGNTGEIREKAQAEGVTEPEPDVPDFTIPAVMASTCLDRAREDLRQIGEDDDD